MTPRTPKPYHLAIRWPIAYNIGMEDPISASEAAERLGISKSRVLQLLLSGQLPGTRVGNRWLVEAAAVVGFTWPRKPGWPRDKPRDKPRGKKRRKPGRKASSTPRERPWKTHSRRS